MVTVIFNTLLLGYEISSYPYSLVTRLRIRSSVLLPLPIVPFDVLCVNENGGILPKCTFAPLLVVV